ncbi:MAG: hypothetical protein LBU14_06415 [Candidatus Peribacteria bacterium]|nr:hypothetical protein [Candidatus Peribacteria bacterium]
MIIPSSYFDRNAFGNTNKNFNLKIDTLNKNEENVNLVLQKVIFEKSSFEVRLMNREQIITELI